MKSLTWFLLFFSLISQAQQPLLVKEINNSGRAYPSEFIPFKGAMYFFALDENNEYALHRTYGEASDVKKLESPSQRAGIGYFGSPKFLAKNENFLYLTIQNKEQYILLKTDGEKQFDYVFLPKKASIYIDENTTTIAKNKLYFLLNVYSGTWKNELWASDGTAVGTYKIKGVNNAKNVFSSHNKLYFNDLDKGSFRVEGDSIMQQHKEITYIAAQKNHLYGLRKMPNLDTQIFSIDSLNQTTLLFTLMGKKGNYIHSIKQLGDSSSLCLLVKDSILFAYEITPNVLKERASLASGLNYYEIPIFVQDSLLFLSFFEYSSTKIYSINLNTWNFKKLYERPIGLYANHINEKGFYVLQACTMPSCNPDQLLFYQYNSNSIDTLLHYYGLKNISYFKDKIFFGYDYNLWVSDNQGKQHKIFKEFNSHNASSSPTGFYKNGQYLYFYAKNKDNALRFCRTNGTTQGTDIYPCNNISGNRIVAETKDKIISRLYTYSTDGFVAMDKTDSIQCEVFYETQDYLMNRVKFFHYNKKDYFFMPKNLISPVYSLWETDATKAGTRKVLDLAKVSTADDYSPYVLFNHLYLVKSTKAGKTIFRANENSNGTFDVSEWKSSIVLHSTLVEFGNDIYFMSKKNNSEDFELNSMNPVTGEQKTIKTFIGGTEILESSWSFLVKHNEVLYIAFTNAERDAPIYKLFTSDGMEVKLLINNDLKWMTSKGNKTNLLFFKTVGNKGEALWQTDGTLANTFKISDVYPTIGEEITYANDSIFYFLGSTFDGATKTYHRQLLQSKGTAASTKVILDSKNMQWDLFLINPLTILNETFFFAYDNGKIGSELYKLPIANLVKTENPLIAKQELQVFPNPVADEISVINPISDIAVLRIYDINGREVKTEILFDAIANVNISNLKSGFYIFEISTKNKLFYKKVVKK